MNLEQINIKNINDIQTEEATKMSLILPFIQELGYNVFDINEVIPEYTADIGKRKGEKVDYAIKINDKINFIIEAKCVNEKLDKHPKQLARYFANTDTKIGILTNGLIYRFFTDVEKDNIMDEEFFYEFNIQDYNEKDIEQLKAFTKDKFDEKKLYGKAEELRIKDSIAEYIISEFEKPSDDFIKLILNSIYEGTKTQNIIQEYRNYIPGVYNKIIDKELVNKMKIIFPDKDISIEELEKKEDKESKKIIETTEIELALYNYIQVILKDEEDLEKISWRDNSSYFNILFDNKITKWFVRVYDKKQLKIGIYNGEKEEIYELNSCIEVFEYKSQIIEALKKRK